MAIIQVSKIQQRSGNIVDLPKLDEAEFGWATDVKRLYIGKTTPDENIEVLTSYSNINFSQINGSYGNLNIDSTNLANGQILTYTGSEWTNRGSELGGLINLGDVSNVKIDGGSISYVLETDGTGNLSWAPKSTVISYIEKVTKASTGVVTTVDDNYLVNASLITITNVPGMTQLNGNSYYAKVVSANTFQLYSDSGLTTPVNTSGYSTFPYTTVTATTTGTNRITVGASAAFTINDPVVFVGTTFGGIVEGTTYYVLTKPTSTTLTISATLGGSVFELSTASGSANVYASGGRIVSSWISGGGGGGSGVAGGTNTTVQFNNTNVLDGSSDFTFNFGTTPKILTLNGNANVGNLNATTSVIASTLTSNASTGTAPLVVTSTTRVANLNVANSNVADFAGNVTIAAQANITSVGTLTTLNVNARVNATGYTSNVATGTAPLTVTSTTRVANLNVSYANVSDFEVVTTQTTGTFYPVFVNGNTTANYALGSNASIAFNAATGNLQTNILYANGNIIGANLVSKSNTGAQFNIIGSTQTTTNTLGGNINITSGAGNGNAQGGNLNFTAGAADTTATGLANGGSVNITAGTSYGTGQGGSLYLYTGLNGNTSGGGQSSIILDSGSNVGSGGSVQIKAADGKGTNKVAGNVNIMAGSSTGSAAAGRIVFVTATPTTSGTTVQTPANRAYIDDSQVNITVSTNSTSSSTGSLVIAGGAGVGGNLYVGGTINGNITNLTTGANTTAGSVTGNWTLTAGSRWNATYADLAEYYNADQHYEPGTVLEFGGVNELTIASNNTTCVAGVVSTDPAFAMNAKCHGEYPVAIALQGRVPTKVTGTIRKGDMMVSSGNGYATACSSPTLGTVIGKSLENFNGTGIIEIAVGRL